MFVYIETLGCSRNQVDSEIMLGKLAQAGHVPTDEPENAQVIIVNTCGFISSAAQEAIDVTLELARCKEQGQCRRLIMTGCLAQRYKDDPELIALLPEVDAFMGTAACEQIVSAVDGGKSSGFVLFPEPETRRFYPPSPDSRVLTSEAFSYVKVSEGCNRHCTYCMIPGFRGRQRSRPVQDIEQEIAILLAQGKKQIILTGENTTDWGQDLPGRPGFDQVLERCASVMEKEDPQAWLQFLYTHPASLNQKIIETAAAHPNICSYYDVPIQHASTAVLKKMGRPYTRENLYDLVELIRATDPDAALRTSVIVGFPGETKEDFDILVQFVENIKFDHLGVFMYSDSQELVSHGLGNFVPEELAQLRHDTIMGLQTGISEACNQKHLGKEYWVLVEENPEPGLFLGRTQFQAPEVDGVTFIYSPGLAIGTHVRVKITDVFPYDIAGEVL